MTSQTNGSAATPRPASPAPAAIASRAPRPARDLDEAHLPYGVRLAAAWSWRFVVMVVAAAILVYALRTVSSVVVPLAVAALLAVLLQPAVGWLTRRGLKRALSSLAAVLGLIALVVAGMYLAGSQLATGISGMVDSAKEGVQQIQDWLRDGPLHLSSAQMDQYLTQLRSQVDNTDTSLAQQAMAVGSSAGHFLAGTVIALIATFFYLFEGERIWGFVVRLLPRAAQKPTHEAARRAWVSLGAYARTQVLVAGVVAVGIGLGALILGLPFVVPITLLVFISSFVPIVGAIVSGAVAVLIALVVKGPIFALIMLGIVLLVQQLESHALQPFLMGKAVSLHPLAVIAAIAIGSFLLGIVGALFAVPVLAVVNSVGHYLTGHDPFPELGTTTPEPPPTTGPDDDGETTAEGGKDVPIMPTT